MGWSTHRTARLVAAAALAGFVVPTADASAAPARGVRCPLESSSTIPSGEAWAFHDTGLPSTPHPGVASAYIHGRGGWAGGRGSGTICWQNRAASGGSHDIVLTVSGSLRLSPRVTRLGHPGVVLVLHASVAASDDPACAAGAHGTVTIFASYYEGHHDSVELRFNSGCTPYDAAFLGPTLYALIAENGRQVN